MRSMTVQQRMDDIVQRSGMSEDIVRRVLMAEQKSVVDSLKHGENATLIGRCVIIPELRSKLQIGGAFKKYIKLSAEVTGSLSSELSGLENFEKQEDSSELPDGVRLMQLNSLI